MTHQWLNSEPDKGYEEIISCIDQFAQNHEKADLEHSAVLPEKTEERGSSRRKNIAIILAAAGAVIAVALNTQSRDNAGGSDGLEPSDISSQTAEIQSAEEAYVIIESDPKNTDKESQAADPEFSSSVQSEPEDTESAPESQPQEQVTEPAETTVTSSSAQTKPPVASEPQEAESVPETAAAQVELGDSIFFGTYNNEPVEWRVINLSEDKTQAVVIANSIITMKAYDAAESGNFNYYDGSDYWNVAAEELDAELQRMIRGDNRWEFSNIRTWLNSDREIVTYNDQPPTSQAMTEKRNGYHTEAGFLNTFTTEELSAIVETKVKTGSTLTEDKVFLLSTDEVQWLYDADVSVYAIPTQAAVEQDSSKWVSR